MRIGKLCRNGLFAVAMTATFVGTASATVLYQDNFSGASGNLGGRTPTTTTGSNFWTGVGGDFSGVTPGAYVTNGSTVSQNGSVIDGWAYLAVNGGSGATLDGTVDFTLSAVVTTSTGDQYLGIGLATSQYNGGSAYNGGQPGVYAALGIKPANSVSTSPTAVINFSGGVAASTPTAISLNYSASAGTIAYVVGGTTRATLSGVSASNILALNYVAIWSGSFGNNAAATLDDFTLSTASVPEPSTYALMLGGLGALVVLRRRRSATRA